MKLKIELKNLSTNYTQWLRQEGYHFVNDRRTGKASFMRSLARGNYPRFHVYMKEDGDNLWLDLHLDQKEASYGGQHMHNGEYAGDLVEAEIARLANSLGISVNDFNNTETPKEVKKLPEAYRPTVERTRFSGKGFPFAHSSLEDYVTPPPIVKKWWQIFK
ncbi:hypothetical protein COT94_02590 [Candidatus Falkowbacteria bacterium CG10_big_fil_rev_8_21_14_0_10_37_14]|uniref:Uncharacterized protein n=1 Tax=Candidatus Falkowbacteria bacterium CG10_big_fil_rev_8_21_14_0_10_37_14 TaxID=1974561 RepID=A0A2M6WTP4_9BACT|nr:hypothetical protein [Candidatus Falkowbacteria bacterium]PIT96121.1 MAG: hypothetical protein COT94_02590 [Candidatus Falkowbacteria bacterium CG10_big_fil_rev_8_21_14_0_10_37_14]